MVIHQYIYICRVGSLSASRQICQINNDTSQWMCDPDHQPCQCKSHSLWASIPSQGYSVPFHECSKTQSPAMYIKICTYTNKGRLEDGKLGPQNVEVCASKLKRHSTLLCIPYDSRLFSTGHAACCLLVRMAQCMSPPCSLSTLTNLATHKWAQITYCYYHSLQLLRNSYTSLNHPFSPHTRQAVQTGN